MNHVQLTMYNEPCTTNHVQWTMYNELCTINHVRVPCITDQCFSINIQLWVDIPITSRDQPRLA